MKKITVFSPATVANVASGFDIFGFALEQPGDILVVELTDSPGVSLTIVGNSNGLPKDPQHNTATVSAVKMLEFLKIEKGVKIELHKKMPLQSGLGSSAASSAGSVFAINALLDYPLTPHELIRFAMVGELVACGTAHADNVGPALLGGFVIIRSYEPLDIISIPLNIELYCTILHPDLLIKTEDARKVLKAEVSLKQHITQSGNAAGLIAGLMLGNSQLIGHCLQDVIAEPLRAPLIRGFYDIKQSAIDAGALGCSISGSGPSLFALTTDEKHAQEIGKQMSLAAQKHQLTSQVYVSKINKQGPKIIS